MSALDVQRGGDHYKNLSIQPVEFVMKNHMGFCEGNVVKYVTRWRNKGGLQDLDKAQHFIQFLIEDSPYQTVQHFMSIAFHQRGCLPADSYIEANDLSDEEGAVITAVLNWSNTGLAHNLEAAAESIQSLITIAKVKS